MSRVRVYPQKLECPFESEAGLLDEVDDQGGTIGLISGVTLPSDEPLRSAEEERRRGDYWRLKAVFYRLALWSEKTGERRHNQEIATMIKMQPLRDAVAPLKASGDYENSSGGFNAHAAATWLIDNTTPDGDKKVWGYDVDNPPSADPPSREKARRNLANRIRRLDER